MASVMASIAGRVREFLRGDRDSKLLAAAQGVTASTLPSATYDLLQNYGYDVVADYLRVEQDLLSRMLDYEAMDDYGPTSVALNIYADDMTQPDAPTGRAVWVESPDRDIATLLNDFLHRGIRYGDDLRPIARSLCKFGNDYSEIVVGEEGVIGLNHLPAHTMRRIEGPRGELYGFVQDFRGRVGYSPHEFQEILTKRLRLLNSGYTAPGERMPNDRVAPLTASELDAIPFEPWQVAHMRLRTKWRKSLYGFSVLEPARWIVKRLWLLEDSALIYRLQRTAERYAVYVDIGSRPPREALQLLNYVRHQFKKKRFVNPVTNQIDLKFNSLSQDEDVFIPVVDGKESSRVDVLGSPSWQSMDDINYFLSHLFTALLIPKAYLGHDESLNRTILSSEDVRFARTVLANQVEVKHGTEHICRVHLAALGIPPEAVEFDVRLTVPSAIFELAQFEVRNARADFATRVRDHVSLRWILSNVYNLSDEDVERIFIEREDDIVRDAKAMAKAEQLSGGGGGGGGLGGRGGRGFMGSQEDPPKSRLLTASRGVITERELLTHDKARASGTKDAIDRVIRQNQSMGRQVQEVRGLLQELRYLVPRSK